MSKFKCNNCSEKDKTDYIFKSKEKSPTCPRCGCPDVEIIKTNYTFLIVSVIIVVVMLVLLFLLNQNSNVGVIEPKGPISKEIRALIDTTSQMTLKVVVDGSTEKDLKALYKIEMTNDSTEEKKYFSFNGTSNSIEISKEDLCAGVQYNFMLVERKTGLEPNEITWENGNNTYSTPIPPDKPQISITKEIDCETQTYTLLITVEKGNPDRFYVDEKEYSSNTITGIKDGIYYTIKAYDSQNVLWSEDYNINCEKIKINKINQKVIQNELDKIARRETSSGDALKRISNGRNIDLSTPIDGNTKLEGAIKFSRNQKKQYYVTDIKSKSTGCVDVIETITLSTEKP